MYLENNTEFLNSILESSYTGIMTCDAEGTINFVNGRAEEITGSKSSVGIPLDVWMANSTLRYIDRDDPLPGDKTPLYRALKFQEVVRNFDVRLFRRDGSIVFCKLSSNPLFNKEKKQIGALITLVDITTDSLTRNELSTQNRRLQESVQERTSILQDLNIALGRSQTRFRTIVEQSPFGIQIFNTKGKTILINPAWKKIFNLPEEFIQNFILKEYNVLEDPLLEKNGILHIVKRAFNGETVTIPEIYYNPRDLGHDFDGKWIESIMYPLKQPDGEIREIVLIHNDVTERHVSRDQKKRFVDTQNFMSRVTDILLSTIDFESIIERIAKSSIPFLCDGAIVDLIEGDEIKRVIARHNDPTVELAMKDMAEYYPPRSDSQQPSSIVIRTGKPELLRDVNENVIVSHTIDERHAGIIRRVGIRSHIAVPLVNQDKIIGALNFLITTDRRPFDEEDLAIGVELARRAALAISNARLYRDAKSAIQQRDDFISIASHELKTPITSLKLQQEVIIKSLSSDYEQSKDDIQFIMRAARNSNTQLDRLARLVEDMLDISRITTGKLAMNFREIDFTQMTTEVLERFGHQMKTLGISLIVDKMDKVALTCDQYRMEQVLTNLMTNAIRYGSKKPITVALRKYENSITFEVKDQGMGIAKEDQERIFNRFERAISFDTISGLGLGLFISRQIVHDHGGTLTVDSKLNRGSTFKVTINLNQ